MKKLKIIILSNLFIFNIFCNNKIVRIITPDSGGLITDAKIYNNLIPGSYIYLLNNNEKLNNIEKNKKVDINLFLEYIPLDANRYKAKENWLMVNQELFNPVNSSFIDTYICKSKYAQKLLKKNLKNKKIYYTSHTSQDVLESKANIEFKPKDYNLFLHLAGKSLFKNTDKVLMCWIENKGFENYNYPKLIVTICDIGLKFNKNLKNILKGFIQVDDHLEHKIYKNIIVYNKYLEKEKLKKLQETAGAYICPSYTEGFGHYINEGRSAGAIVITTDAPPMNELITKENGILIKPTKTVSSQEITRCPCLKGSKAFLMSTQEIKEAVNKYMLLTLDQKIKMGQISRSIYLADTDYLINSIREIFEIK